MTTKFNFNYPFVLREQKEGGYLVQFQDFPEAITQCDDKEDALNSALDCLEEAIANRMVMGLDIPSSNYKSNRSVLIPLPITLAEKCALYIAMKNNKEKNVSLAKKLKCDVREFRRLLVPKYKSKILKIEEALSVLGKKTA